MSMEFSILTTEEFDRFAKWHPQGSFVQTSQFSKVRNVNGFLTELIGIKEDGKISAAAVLANHRGKINKYDMLCGPLLDWDNGELVKFFTYSVREYVSRNNGDLISITPNVIYNFHTADGKISKNGYGYKFIRNLKRLGWCHQGFNEGYGGQPRWLFVKDVRFTELPEVEGTYKKTTRQRVRKAEKYGVTIRGLEYRELPKFKCITQETSNRIGFSDKTIEYYQELYRQLGDNAHFMAAIYENKIIAVSLFMETKSELVYLSSGTNENYRKLNGAHLLQDWAIKYCIENRIPRYNFYGISGKFDGSDGVLEFKKGFGGYIEELPGEFVLPINKWKYLAWKMFKKLGS